ncbi:hypothetical protein VTK73DRAFT_2571 [Phialemonium thermophilum]|uniref:Uncharacterized protein n=1 Tax=Phialemonium thermophilum TaxID=223376 RepID=A0ABR3VRZ9_9PEZI
MRGYPERARRPPRPPVPLGAQRRSSTEVVANHAGWYRKLGSMVSVAVRVSFAYASPTSPATSSQLDLRRAGERRSRVARRVCLRGGWAATLQFWRKLPLRSGPIFGSSVPQLRASSAMMQYRACFGAYCLSGASDADTCVTTSYGYLSGPRPTQSNAVQQGIVGTYPPALPNTAQRVAAEKLHRHNAQPGRCSAAHRLRAQDTTRTDTTRNRHPQHGTGTRKIRSCRAPR